MSLKGDQRLSLVNAVVEANVLSQIHRAIEIGSVPGLSLWTKPVIIARRWDFEKDTWRVLLGGLGALGCGMMWVEYDPEKHPTYPGWDGAPEMQEP